MSNPGIIRNRLKIYATINNANCFIELKKKENSFSKFLWSFVDGSSIQNKFKNLNEVPSKTDLSIKICEELKKKGFKFVGPIIIYSFMQAAGLVNDHILDCFRNKKLER